MTSEEYIEELRCNGVRMINNDGSTSDIPSDILKKTMELCSSLRCCSITYDIIDPEDSEHTTLKILDCGYAE